MVSEEEQQLEEIKKLDDELKKLENYGSPEPEKKDNVFRFFREILRMGDTTRIANVEDRELGQCKLTVRGYKELSNYARAEGLDKVAKYLENKSEITTSTSMGRKGFWAKLFVTNIKREQKVLPKEEKKGWFSKKTPGELEE